MPRGSIFIHGLSSAFKLEGGTEQEMHDSLYLLFWGCVIQYEALQKKKKRVATMISKQIKQTESKRSSVQNIFTACLCRGETGVTSMVTESAKN